MRIKKIHIKNFKSLVDFELEDLKPFCAFVGPNASGKSNIFEALEFSNYVCKVFHWAPSYFNGRNSILAFKRKSIDKENGFSDFIYFYYQFNDDIEFPIYCSFTNENNKESWSDSLISIDSYNLTNNFNRDANNETNMMIVNNTNISESLPISALNVSNPLERTKFINSVRKTNSPYDNDFEQFIDNFSRLFIGKPQLNRTNQIQNKLAFDASNLSQIIGRIFEDVNKRMDFIEWLKILIPEFKNIEIKKSNIDGSFEFFLYEKSSNKPFPKYLISDGTYNILALMGAVYQSNQPQFLCIEEPENGLHPQAIQLLVDFFREKCEDEGHHIWLNTHSQTLVKCLDIDEIILVNKINGETKAKQLTKADNIDIQTDEAWLTNALRGGVL